MKRIIDGKRYNTETATLIASFDNGLSTTDFHKCTEWLYRTKNGNCFLAGEGGALSRWSEPCGNNGSCGGSGILPMTAEEAVEWLEQHQLTDEIEEYFPDHFEDA